MTTTPLPPITKHSEPMLKNWPWTEVELAWVAARDAQWQAYATQSRADLEAENARLREALSAIERKDALLQWALKVIQLDMDPDLEELEDAIKQELAK